MITKIYFRQICTTIKRNILGLFLRVNEEFSQPSGQTEMGIVAFENSFDNHLLEKNILCTFYSTCRMIHSPQIHRAFLDRVKGMKHSKIFRTGSGVLRLWISPWASGWVLFMQAEARTEEQLSRHGPQVDVALPVALCLSLLSVDQATVIEALSLRLRLQVLPLTHQRANESSTMLLPAWQVCGPQMLYL